MSNIERTYVDSVRDIIQSIEKIEKFTHGYSYEDFINDDKTVYAVIRCFEAPITDE